MEAAMSTTPNAPTLWRRWLHFWFAPGDPTTLGFIRIVTGLLVLYVHLAYCFDLQEFFGENGWYSLKSINVERKEAPWIIGNLSNYDDSFRTPRVPEYPHRREAVMKFIRTLEPLPGGERARKLHYLTLLQETRNPTAARDGLAYVNLIGLAGEYRKAQLDALEKENLRRPQDAIPAFLKELPETGPNSRHEARLDIEQLLDVLPKDMQQREYVLNHLTEMEWWSRKAFLDFLTDLPDDPAERTKLVNYLELWNSDPRQAYHLGQPVFSIWFHISDPNTMVAAHAVILVVMALFTLGLFTRVTAVLTWLAAVSYIHRTQQILFGMDTMMNILLIYLMVGNSGAALSLDRLINRYRAARAGLRRGGKVDAATQAYLEKPPPSVTAGLALRMMQVHFCFIYMASGMSKLKGMTWWNTNAFWDTLVNPEFCPVQYQWFESLLRWAVSERRWVYAGMTSFGVAFTLFMEFSLPYLVWTRLRPYIVIAAFVMHLGIATFMGLYMFSLFMMSLLLAYLPGSVIRDQLFGAASAAKSLTLRFSNRSPRQQRAAALVKALDFDNRVEVVDGAAGVRVSAGGEDLTGRAAAAELFGAVAYSRALRVLLALPVVGGALTAWFAPANGEAPAATPAAKGKQPVGAK
jgi:hypothetical protein